MDIAANINAQLRVSKRTYADDIDFRIVVAPIGTFQTLVGTVHSLLNDVHFFVIKTKDFEGIKVDSATSDFSTVLKQQLTCTVEIPDGSEEKNFCLNVAQLNSRIKSNSSSMLEIVRFKGKEDSINVFYPNANPQREFRLRTLTKDVVDNRLFDIETDISVQIRLGDFKEICRDYAKYGSPHLRIHIQSAKGANLSNHSFITFSCEADGNEDIRSFHSVYKKVSEDDIQVVCDSEKVMDTRTIKDKAKTVYKGTFFLETINHFLKSIDKSFVWLSFSKKGAMIMKYSLGNEQSLMRLICAPCDDDDEEL